MAKRIIAAFLAGVMALGLVSCGDVDESSKGKKSSSSAAAGEASSTVESSLADSQESELDKAESDDFEFLQGLIGKNPDDARTQISERLPQAKEDDGSPLKESGLLGYMYMGDLEIGGVSFAFMTLMADEDNTAVKSIMLVANDNPKQIEMTGEQEYENAQVIFGELLKALTEDFGEPQTRTEDGDYTLTECLWKDKQVSLELACYKSGSDIKYPSLGLTFGSASEGGDKTAEAKEQKPMADISKPEFFENYDAIFAADGGEAMELLQSIAPDGEQGSDDEGINALGKNYTKRNINFVQGKDLLGCGDVHQMNIDFDSENGDIYTVAFRKNQDLNTTDGYTPDPFECKESYEALYKLFSERYGEPQQKFTPENYDFFGALWTDTPCGEIWLAWAEKIFGSQQCDCVVSFSRKGINTSGER